MRDAVVAELHGVLGELLAPADPEAGRRVDNDVRLHGSPPRFLALRYQDEPAVDCVVIGGIAVGLHGHPRATKDLDSMIAPNPENVARLWTFIEAADASPLAVGDLEERELPLPFTPEAIPAGGGNWLLRTRYGRLDVMQCVEGAPAYADLLARSEAGDLEGLSSPVRFCSLDDLLVMKRAAGRAVDLGDIERLEQLNRAPDDCPAPLG